MELLTKKLNDNFQNLYEIKNQKCNEKCLIIDNLISRLKKIKSQIKIDINNIYLLNYLNFNEEKIKENISNLDENSSEIQIEKQKLEYLNSISFMEVKAINKFDNNEGWDTELKRIIITMHFNDNIQFKYKINHNLNYYDKSQENFIDILLIKDNNKRMYQDKRKNQKKKDYCILNKTYYAGSKEEKITNHWTTFLNKIKDTINFENNNFRNFFRKLEID